MTRIGTLSLAVGIACVVGATSPDCMGQDVPEVLPEGGESLREAIDREMNETEAELERIRKDLAAKRTKAQELATMERDLLSEVEGINDEIRTNQQLLATMAEREEVMLKDLEITSEDLFRAEAAYRLAQDQLNQRLNAIYRFGRVQAMEVILLSRTFADLAKRVYYLSVIADHDLELSREFEERVETRRVLIGHIAAKKARLKALELDVRREMRNLELKREERDGLVAQLKEKRYYYEDLATKLEESSRGLEQLLEDLETKREQVRLVGGTFEERRGTLMRPCEGEIVGRFGVETHPRFGTIIRNNGIDIKAVAGTKIRAVAPGMVSYAGALSGFGNCVIVSHGEGFYSLYGHLEALTVGSGRNVREGDAIGTVGETSTPEGAVLHLEIRQGKKPLDPEQWLSK